MIFVACGIAGLTFLVLVGKYKQAEEEALRRRAEALLRMAESRAGSDVRRAQFAKGRAGLRAADAIETVVAGVV